MSPRKRLALAAGFAATLVAYLLLKTHAMHASVTDDNIYFYDALLVAGGAVPYRDFFFAHPPLHLAVPAVVFALFGFSVALGKAIPVVASVVSGACLFAVTLRRLDTLAAFVTLIFFWFATEQLKASSDMSGVNLATAWMCVGFLAWTTDRPLLAGLLLGCGAATGLYTVPAVFVLGGLCLVDGSSRRSCARLGAGFVGAWGLANVVFLLAGGGDYIEGVYTFHLLKPDKPGGTKVWQVFYHHTGLLWSTALAAGVFALRVWRLGWPARYEPLWIGAVALGLTAAFGVQLWWLAEFYDHYLVVILPWLALAAGWFVREWVGVVTRAFRSRSRRDVATAAALSALVVAAWPAKVNAYGIAYPREYERAGDRIDYEWSDPPVLPSLGFVVRDLVWKDHRLRGHVEHGVRHYLWNRKRTFGAADEIAAWIREHTSEEETIAGASTVTPLIALLSERNIAAEFVDTNAKRFTSGITSSREFVEQICAAPIRYLITAPRAYIDDAWVAAWPGSNGQFRLERTFVDQSVLQGADYVVRLYRRVTDASAPPYCEWEPSGQHATDGE